MATVLGKTGGSAEGDREERGARGVEVSGNHRFLRWSSMEKLCELHSIRRDSWAKTWVRMIPWRREWPATHSSILA